MRARLEQIYDEHGQALYAFFLNLCRSEADAHDLLQEVFVKLARQPSLLDDVRDERSFLFKLAHNMFLDFIRRRFTRDKYHEQAGLDFDGLFESPTDPDAKEFSHRLVAALGHLPRKQRAVVHLKLWGDMTFESIGDALGISANTAASRYRYGIDKLRAELRPVYEDCRQAGSTNHHG